MLTPLRGGAARQPDPHPAGLDRIGWEGASDRVARQRSGQAGQGCVGGRSERAAATVAFWQITTDGVKTCVSICSISICRRKILRYVRPCRATVPGCWPQGRSEEHTSELQSLMSISYAVFSLKKKKHV